MKTNRVDGAVQSDGQNQAAQFQKGFSCRARFLATMCPWSHFNVRRMTKQTVAPATRLKSERSSVAYRRTRKNKRANQPVRLSAITTRRHPQNLRSNLVIPARTIPKRMTATFPHHYNVERLPEGDFPPFSKFALRLHQQHARNECAPFG